MKNIRVHSLLHGFSGLFLFTTLPFRAGSDGRDGLLPSGFDRIDFDRVFADGFFIPFLFLWFAKLSGFCASGFTRGPSRCHPAPPSNWMAHRHSCFVSLAGSLSFPPPSLAKKKEQKTNEEKTRRLWHGHVTQAAIYSRTCPFRCLSKERTGSRRERQSIQRHRPRNIQ